MPRAAGMEQLEHFKDAIPDRLISCVSQRTDQGHHPNKINKRYLKKFNKKNGVINSVCKIKNFIELLKDNLEQETLELINATGWVESQLSKKKRVSSSAEDTKPNKKVKISRNEREVEKSDRRKKGKTDMKSGGKKGEARKEKKMTNTEKIDDLTKKVKGVSNKYTNLKKKFDILEAK